MQETLAASEACAKTLLAEREGAGPSFRPQIRGEVQLTGFDFLDQAI